MEQLVLPIEGGKRIDIHGTTSFKLTDTNTSNPNAGQHMDLSSFLSLEPGEARLIAKAGDTLHDLRVGEAVQIKFLLVVPTNCHSKSSAIYFS